MELICSSGARTFSKNPQLSIGTTCLMDWTGYCLFTAFCAALCRFQIHASCDQRYSHTHLLMAHVTTEHAFSQVDNGSMCSFRCAIVLIIIRSWRAGPEGIADSIKYFSSPAGKCKASTVLCLFDTPLTTYTFTCASTCCTRIQSMHDTDCEGIQLLPKRWVTARSTVHTAKLGDIKSCALETS